MPTSERGSGAGQSETAALPSAPTDHEQAAPPETAVLSAGSAADQPVGQSEPAALPSPYPSAPPRRRRPRRVLLATLAVAGLAGLGGGAAGLYAEMGRGATPAEVSAAGQAEVATRWQRLPAGRIFPASISYATYDGLITAARRVGIAPAASCGAGLDTPVAHAVERRGCLRMLRSTYVDTSASLVGTVGVAVMPSSAQAVQALAGFHTTSAGVRAVGFGGTVARLFTDSLRQEFGVVAAGPYLLFYATGHASGLGVTPADSQTLTDFGTGLTTGEIAVLTNGGPPCKRQDIRC